MHNKEPVVLYSSAAALVGFGLDTFFPGAWPVLQASAVFLTALVARRHVSPVETEEE